METSEKIYKFGLVGCGRISGNHFEALKKISDRAELTAVCDIIPQRADDAAQKTGAIPFYSLSEMLSGCDLDIVSVCTPSGLHHAHTLEIARSGRHVICEKPMAIVLDDAKESIKACERAGKALFVVLQNRRNPTLQLLKKAVDTGRFGKIYLVNINVFWQRPQSYYDQASWRGKWNMDGGAFMNQASHYVDLLNWLIGPIESVHSYTATLARNIEAEDTGVANILWKSGAMGSLNVTMLTYPANLEGAITILGEKGTARIGGLAVNEIQHWDFKDKTDDDEQIRLASYETTSVYGHGHGPYYLNVINALDGKEEIMTDGFEGIKSLEVLCGLYQSSREGRRVQFPLI